MRAITLNHTKKYYKIITQTITDETTWNQPKLSANGTMGGNSFACDASTSASTLNYQTWKALDNSNSTAWATTNNNPTGWYTFYNPTGLRLISLTIQNPSANSGILNYYGVATSGSILASDTNSNFTQLTTFTNSKTSSGQSWTINVNSSQFYKYHRINITASSKANTGTTLSEIIINAKYGTTSTTIVVEESTSSDYDYDVDLYDHKIILRDENIYQAING